MCDQAHQSLWRGARGHDRRSVYARRDADALAAFGGIVGLNRPLDELTAAIVSTFIEAVVAPSVLPEALPVLQTKANMRVVTANFDALAGAPGHGRELRSILGGLLVQRRDEVGEARSEWPTGDLKVVTARQPSTDEWEALRFAWRVMAHVKSNTVIFTDGFQTRAIGAGQ